MVGFRFCYYVGRFLVVRARHFVGQADREPDAGHLRHLHPEWAGRDLVKLANENVDWVEHKLECVGRLSSPYLFCQKSSFFLSVRILDSDGCYH